MNLIQLPAVSTEASALDAVMPVGMVPFPAEAAKGRSHAPVPGCLPGSRVGNFL
jgi:hypothetical protein